MVIAIINFADTFFCSPKFKGLIDKAIRYILCIILIVCGIESKSQSTQQIIASTEFSETHEIAVNGAPQITLKTQKHYSSFVIETQKKEVLLALLVLVNNNSTPLRYNDHDQHIQGIYRSVLIMVDSLSDELRIITENIANNAKIKIHFYFAGTTPKVIKKTHASVNLCVEPDHVAQSTWRYQPSELPPPVITPTETDVSHIIIHHSAVPNSNNNYQDVVRNIYLHHTQTNGWDDIGYNYLIAPDGTIYRGRDSQELFDHDNVRGAHMCGKNNYTMAICLLGNFEEESPSAIALQQLIRLSTWKLYKENISPLDSSMHAIGPSSANAPDALLAHIAGHKDGCTPGYTLCPGKNLYSQMAQIRQAIQDSTDQSPCLFASTNQIDHSVKQFVIDYVNKVLIIKSSEPLLGCELYTLNGKKIFSKELQSTDEQIDIPPIRNTLAICMIQTSKGSFRRKIWLP